MNFFDRLVYWGDRMPSHCMLGVRDPYVNIGLCWFYCCPARGTKTSFGFYETPDILLNLRMKDLKQQHSTWYFTHDLSLFLILPLENKKENLKIKPRITPARKICPIPCTHMIWSLPQLCQMSNSQWCSGLVLAFWLFKQPPLILREKATENIF